MKVLVIHNSYKVFGGEDVSTLAEVALLKENNVEVDTYYVSNKEIRGTNNIMVALNAIWSSRQYRKVLEKIKTGKYDIVHIQNFFPLLSPSILYAVAHSNAKVVMSVRNYRLICPNAMMYVNGAICNRCVGKPVPFPALVHTCYRNSFAASAAVVAMLSLHNFLNTWQHKIDAFICVSNFVRDQLIAGGMDESKLLVKYNFVSTSVPVNLEVGQYYIYSGRLSDEKGIDVLLHAFRGSKRMLLIAGEGPLKEIVEKEAAENPHIRYVGKCSLLENYQFISKAKALIFPSKWHEPFGRTIVEAFAHGTPVIASALGGVTELVTPGLNGLLFDPYQNGSLIACLDAFDRLEESSAMRRCCYQTYLKLFAPETNFKDLMEIYQGLINKGPL